MSDLTEYPSDEYYQKWLKEYGSTGVKNHRLQFAENQGCVAVYRETSMAERQALARVLAVTKEYPGAFQKERMVVSACLLYPTLDQYPHSGKAAGELYPRIKAQSHGIRAPDDDVFEDDDGTVLPHYMIDDIRNARAAASRVFNDPELQSIYKDLAMDLAAASDGSIETATLLEVWKMTPGQVRDFAAVVEQINAVVRLQSKEALMRNTEYDKDQKREIAEKIARQHSSPFKAIDAVVGDAATPRSTSDTQQEKPASEPEPEPSQPQNEWDTLPPNRPVRAENMDQVVKNMNR